MGNQAHMFFKEVLWVQKPERLTATADPSAINSFQLADCNSVQALHGNDVQTLIASGSRRLPATASTGPSATAKLQDYTTKG